MSEHELYHYGVLGMKWGVRKNPSRAYAKALRKKNRLYDRGYNLMEKGSRHSNKADGVAGRIGESIPLLGRLFAPRNAYHRIAGSELTKKGTKLVAKGRRWENAMDRTFKHYTIETIPDGNIKAGESLVHRMLYGNDSYNVVKREG